MKNTIVILAAMLAGALARDLFVGRAGAEEQVLRRTDVTAIVRALEGQTKAMGNQARATDNLVRATQDVARNCKR